MFYLLMILISLYTFFGVKAQDFMFRRIISLHKNDKKF